MIFQIVRQYLVSPIHCISQKLFQTVSDIKVLGSQLWSSVIKQHLSIERDHHGAFSHVQKATHHIASLPQTSQWLNALMVPLSLKATGRQEVRKKKETSVQFILIPLIRWLLYSSVTVCSPKQPLVITTNNHRTHQFVNRFWLYIRSNHIKILYTVRVNQKMSKNCGNIKLC